MISTLIPESRLAQYTWMQGLAGMLVMLVISMPMYICATTSVPLDASLVVAGMSPRAALVLLMAGPTTNVATKGAIYRTFGKGVLAIYLATVAVMSMVLGSLFNRVITDMPRQHQPGYQHGLPGGISIAAVLAQVPQFEEK